MSIIEVITGGLIMPQSVLAHREDFDVDSEDEPIFSSGFEGCPDVLKVFADGTGNYLQNDFSSFLSKSVLYDVTWSLDKDCENIADLNDDTLGTYYAKGYWSIANGFTSQQANYSGFVLDWSKVLSVHGIGKYRVTITFKIGDTTVLEICSCNFLLQVYSHQNADKTVRFRTLQNGHILDSFDYTGMNWEQSWRMSGFFGYPQDKLEVDNYLDKNRNITQIQDQLFKEYTLQTDFIAECFKHIFNDILLSNEIFIDDYNLKNAYLLQNIDVIPTQSDSNYFIESTKTFKEIIFEDRDRRKIKRNVK